MDRQRWTFNELATAGHLIFGDGYRTRKDQLGTEGYPILRVAEVLDGRIAPTYSEYVRPEYRTAMRGKVSRAGDVVLTTKGTVGRVAIIPEGMIEHAYSPQVCYFRLSEPAPLTSRFLYYWLRSDEFRRQASGMKGQTDMADYLNLTDVGSLSITAPALEEQRAITEVLGALDDRIAANERVVATMETLLRTHFAAYGFDDVRESEDTVRIDSLIEFNPAVPKPRVEEAVYVDMAALPTDLARVRRWATRPPSGGARFTNGDTVMARITPCLENGKTAFIDFMATGEVGIGSTEFVVMRPRQGVPDHFPYLLARSPRFRAHAIRSMTGSSGRQRCQVDRLVGYPVPKPKAEALAHLQRHCAPVFDLARSLDDMSRTLADLRDTLLPQLMTGRLHVKDATRVVEEAV